MSSRRTCVGAWTSCLGGLAARVPQPVGQILRGVPIGLALLLGSSAAASELTTTRITNDSDGSPAFDHYPDISGSNVVWTHCDGESGTECLDGDYEIHFWDGVITIPITNNETSDWLPRISGSNVVWTQCDGGTGPYCADGDLEIYLWDGAVTTQITNNTTDDWAPAISGSNVVWYGSDGTNKSEIYLWTAGTTVPITDNSVSDMYPAISGANVVWMRDDGNDYEIYMSTFTTPVPVPSISFGGLALLAGLVICFVAWARRGG